MKLGTVLAIASAAGLALAQPAAAETRSAQSLPAAGAPGKITPVRGMSKMGKKEEVVGVPFLVVLAGLGAVFVVMDVAGVFHILTDGGSDSP